MTNEEMLSRVAPCGLHCGKCLAYTDGDIRKAAIKMKADLGNFEPYADRFALLLDPIFEKYRDFKLVLDYLAEASCNGCRKEKCKVYKACKVRDCALEDKKVEFCFECDEFPCDHSGFDSNLEKRSVNINKRIKEIGLEAYYKEIKDKSKY